MANDRNGYYCRRRLGRPSLRTAAEQQHQWRAADRADRKAARVEAEVERVADFDARVRVVLQEAWVRAEVASAGTTLEVCAGMRYAIDGTCAVTKAAFRRIPGIGVDYHVRRAWLVANGFWE